MNRSYLILFPLTLACTTPRETTSDSDSTVSQNKVDSTQTLDYESAMRIETYLAKGSVNSKDLTILTEPCAIYVIPDSEAIEAMQKEYGEDFATIADDLNWYLYESGKTLDSLNIAQPEVKTRYVEFKLSSGQSFIIDSKASSEMNWNLFFFHPNKKPKVVSMPGLTIDSIRAYFEIQ
jgi:hypothetical protein